MAQKVTVQKVDDIDGTEAHHTVNFGLDGVDYTIDLSTEHYRQLIRTLEPFTQAARKLGGRKNTTTLKAKRNPAEIAHIRAARAWGHSTGQLNQAAGRLSAEFMAKYNAHLAESAQSA